MGGKEGRKEGRKEGERGGGEGGKEKKGGWNKRNWERYTSYYIRENATYYFTYIRQRYKLGVHVSMCLCDVLSPL